MLNAQVQSTFLNIFCDSKKAKVLLQLPYCEDNTTIVKHFNFFDLSPNDGLGGQQVTHNAGDLQLLQSSDPNTHFSLR